MARQKRIILCVLAGGMALSCRARWESDPRQIDAVAHERRCLLEHSSKAQTDSMAVLCAEWFVARNGYTDDPPTSDSAAIASESIEWSRGRPSWLTHRHNSLSAHASVICRGDSS